MKTIKAPKNEIELHEAIKEGDNTALSRLYDLYGTKVITSLKSWYPKIAAKDDAQILEAVNEAFWGYSKNPFTYDIHTSTLQRFLEVAAERDLKNILAKEKKHANREELPDDVELEEKFWNRITKTGGPTDGEVIESELLKNVNKELSNYFKNGTDVNLAKLVLVGERETEVFSELLQIKHMTIEEQRSEVKKHKDRIKKVIERNEVEKKIKSILR